jgi:hypothetical protein
MVAAFASANNLSGSAIPVKLAAAKLAAGHATG